MKPDLRRKAVALRRQGFSYAEILREVPVAKSTLSLWLRSVGLSKPQKQRLTEKKLAAAIRGGEAKRLQRILKTQQIQERAIKDVKKISRRELWLIGTVLYWAEGSKEKEGKPGSGVQFTNSDPYMIKIFLIWLNEICEINNENLSVEIYIHENSKNRVKSVINYWSNATGLPKRYFSRVYYKKNKIKTNRKNIGSQYFGLLKIRVKASSSLNRRIAGWVIGVIQSLDTHALELE